MNTSPKERKGRQVGSLNAVVYSLIVLAVFLAGLAGWQRYSQKGRSEPGDAAERRIDAFLSSLGISADWVPVGGLTQTPTGTPMYGFVCRRCQSSCWTHAGAGCPACPFCGVAMARQGLDQPGLRVSLVGGAGTAGLTLPIAIQAGATPPQGHGERGVCTNCHTVLRPGASSFGQMAAGAVQNNPKALWQGNAAAAIGPDAVKPTLIEEIGIEIGPAGGAGARVTGVMGNSFATRAGLQPGDIIIECNGAPVRGVEQFQQSIAQAPPEADARIKVMRNGRTRDLTVMIGQGEMDGFTAIRRW
jgi:hypothetical protein